MGLSKQPRQDADAEVAEHSLGQERYQKCYPCRGWKSPVMGHRIFSNYL